MALLAAAPLIAVRLPGPVDPAQRGTPLWASTDTALALSLFTTWAARTGRMLRAAPVSALTPEELLDFSANDQLELPTIVAKERPA